MEQKQVLALHLFLRWLVYFLYFKIHLWRGVLRVLFLCCFVQGCKNNQILEFISFFFKKRKWVSKKFTPEEMKFTKNLGEHNKKWSPVFGLLFSSKSQNIYLEINRLNIAPMKKVQIGLFFPFFFFSNTQQKIGEDQKRKMKTPGQTKFFKQNKKEPCF